MLLSDVCLSRTSGLNQEQRDIGRPKMAQRCMTRAPLSRSKGQMSTSPGRFTQRGLNAWGRCSSDRENVLGVGTTATLRLLCGSRGAGRPQGRRGAGAYRVATRTACYAPASNRRGIKRCFCLTSDVCLSVAYIGPKSRTERPKKTKIGTEIAHVTRDSDTIFKVKRSKVKVTRPLYSARP